jgi:hypothetical protein
MCSEVTALRGPVSLVPVWPPWYISGMSDDRKKPLWPWIAALLIGVPVLYVASFGPACWIISRAGQWNVLWAAAHFIYSPVLQVWNHDGTISDAIDWYANLGAGPNVTVTVAEVDGIACLGTISHAP